MTGETSQQSRRSANFRQLLAWAVAAFLTVPPNVILHELGHYAAAKAFRFPRVIFHYGSVDDDAEEKGYPAWQRGIKSLAGPIVTVLLVLASCIAARRYGPRPLAVSFGFGAGVRSVIIGVVYIGLSLFKGRQTRGGYDEAQAAQRFNLPIELVVGVFTLAVLVGWVYLARQLPAKGRWAKLVAIAAGVAAGIGLWAVIGPWVLP